MSLRLLLRWSAFTHLFISLYDCFAGCFCWLSPLVVLLVLFSSLGADNALQWWYMQRSKRSFLLLLLFSSHVADNDDNDDDNDNNGDDIDYNDDDNDNNGVAGEGPGGAAPVA